MVKIDTKDDKFTYTGTRPRWRYKYQSWHKVSRRRCNYLCRILSNSVKVFPSCEGPKMRSFIDFDSRPYNRCCLWWVFDIAIFHYRITVSKSKKWYRNITNTKCSFAVANVGFYTVLNITITQLHSSGGATSAGLARSNDLAGRSTALAQALRIALLR